MSTKIKIQQILSQLPPMIDDFMIDGEHHAFSAGDYYVQHIPEVLEKVQREFLDLCYQETDNKIFLSEKVHRQGIVGRYLDDGGGPLYKGWYRFMCIDDEYREWGQPYFAINADAQEKAKSKRALNFLLPQLKDYFIVYQRDEKIKDLLDIN